MKKSLLLILCGCMFFISVRAQEENQSESENSVITLNGSSYDFIFNWSKKAKESHWTGLGFAFSQLNNLEGADLNLSRSYSIILNVGDYIVPINRNWLFVTGAGLDFSRYQIRGNNALQVSDNITQFVPGNETQEYRNNRLIVRYVTIPLLLEYQARSFFIYGGVEGLINVFSRSRAEIKTPDDTKKVSYKNLNILPLNFRFTLRAGIDDFSVFGYYQPISMFEKDKGPNVNSSGIGIMLNF